MKKKRWGDKAGVRSNIMLEMHSSAIGGHSGMQATYQRIKKKFYWPGRVSFVLLKNSYMVSFGVVFVVGTNWN